MATIEQSLQQDRQGTPFTYGKDKNFNKRMEKYTQGSDIDEDTGYKYSTNVFNDILGERVDAWVKKNKQKLEKMDSGKALGLYVKQVDLIKQGMKKQFPENAKYVEDEYSRRTIAEEQAVEARVERERVVSAGKLGLDMDEADRAMLSNPNYISSIGSTEMDIKDAKQRQADLSLWKQQEEVK